MKFSDSVGDPSYFPAPLPHYLYHISFRRYLALSVKVVEKRTNVKVSWPHFFPGMTPTVLWQIVSAIYHPAFGKVWLSCVC